MISKEQIIKRLAYIKQLYKIGVEQSKKSEHIATFSILAFHDSIEMFLKLAAEYKNVKSDNLRFSGYWDVLTQLTLKESMWNFNKRRVNLKHHGILPSKTDIEISRVNTTEFFKQNTEIIFGLDFDSISLIELVQFENVKEHLIESQIKLEKHDFVESVTAAAIAFDELLINYEKNKGEWGQSPFDFSSEVSRYHVYNSRINDETDRAIELLLDKVTHLGNSLKILSLGIDFREYSKFEILTPSVQRTLDGTIFTNFGLHGSDKIQLNNDNCHFCIDFVISTSLKLQEFDFDIQELLKS